MWDPDAFATRLEAWEERFWEDIDTWLLDMLASDNASWVTTAAVNLPRVMARTGSKLLTGTAADLLRLGTFDPDDDSVWGVAKGVGQNALRLLAVAGPAGRAAGFTLRYAGLVGATKLKTVVGSTPCTRVALNNVLTLLRGRKVQFFQDIKSLVSRGLDPKVGGFNIDLIKNPAVMAEFNKVGVFAKQVFNLNTIDDVVRFARTADGPVTIGIKWKMPGAADFSYHEITVWRDAFGKIKFMDYFEGKTAGFKGFDSVESLVRTQWGQAIRSVTLDGGPIVHYSSQFLTLLKELDGTFVFAIPMVAGIRPNSDLTAMLLSLWTKLKTLRGPSAPPAPPELTTGEIPTVTKTLLVEQKPPYWYWVREGIPEADWPSSRAQRHYQNSLLWPLIYEATREDERLNGGIKWRNQNKLKPGQQIYVPDISGYPQAKIDKARERGKDWKRVDP